MKSFPGEAALDSPIRRLFKGLMSLKYIVELLDKIEPMEFVDETYSASCAI